MKTIEYRDVQDKSKWLRGPWDNEPDKIQWQDEATGLPCLIVRSHMGFLCGYVGVDQSHPLYRKHYDGEQTGEQDSEIFPGGKYPIRDYDNAPSAKVSVHGGLTFSNSCHDSVPENEGICHRVEPGENDKVWWFGFDCGHAFDYSPGMHQYMLDWAETKKEFGFSAKGAELVSPLHNTYRDVAYVKAECTNLAKQLKDMQNERKSG